MSRACGHDLFRTTLRRRCTFTLAGALALLHGCSSNAPSSAVAHPEDGGLPDVAPAAVIPPLDAAGPDVSPELECVAPREDGGFTALFSYRTTAPEMRKIPIGDANFFSAGEPDRGQPTLFVPLLNEAANPVFAVAAESGQTLVWHLGSQTAVASETSTPCKEGVMGPDLGAAVAITAPTRAHVFYTHDAQIALEGTIDGTVQRVRVANGNAANAAMVLDPIDARLSPARDHFSATVPLSTGQNLIVVTVHSPADQAQTRLTVVRLPAEATLLGSPTVAPTTVIQGSGTFTKVTLTAPQQSGLQLTRRAADGQPISLATFRDDGLEGDEVAGDGVQTARISLTSLSPRIVPLWVSRADGSGDAAPVGVVRVAADISAADIAGAWTLLADLERVGTASDTPQKAVVETAFKSVLVTDARPVRGGTGVSVLFKTGFSGLVSLAPEDSRAAISNKHVNLDRQFLKQPTDMNFIGSKEVGYLDSLLANQKTKDLGFTVNRFEATPGRSLVDREITLESLAGMNRYAFVLLATHGNVSYDWPEQIVDAAGAPSAEQAFEQAIGSSKLSLMPLIYTTLASDALDLSSPTVKQQLVDGEIVLTSGGLITVTDRFLERHLGQFPENSVFMSQFCVGVKTPRLWATLRDKGVTFFTGWPIYVLDRYAAMVGTDFAHCLLATRGPNGEPKTVRTCFDEQKLANKPTPVATDPKLRCSEAVGTDENLSYCVRYNPTLKNRVGLTLDRDYWVAQNAGSGDDITLVPVCPDGRWNPKGELCCPEGTTYDSMLNSCLKGEKNEPPPCGETTYRCGGQATCRDRCDPPPPPPGAGMADAGTAACARATDVFQQVDVPSNPQKLRQYSANGQEYLDFEQDEPFSELTPADCAARAAAISTLPNQQARVIRWADPRLCVLRITYLLRSVAARADSGWRMTFYCDQTSSSRASLGYVGL